MAFKLAFSRLRTREDLIAALNIDEWEFTNVLEFEPPPRRLASAAPEPPPPTLGTIEIPAGRLEKPLA